MITLTLMLAAAVALLIGTAAVVRRVREGDVEVAAFLASARDIDRRLESQSTSLAAAVGDLGAIQQDAIRQDVLAGLRPSGLPRRIVQFGDHRVAKSFASWDLGIDSTEISPLRQPSNGQQLSALDTLGLSAGHPVSIYVPTLGRHGSMKTSGQAIRNNAGQFLTIEDVLATKAVASRLRASWPEVSIETRIIDPHIEWHGVGANIVSVCRDRRNPVTGALLNHPATRALFRLGFEPTRRSAAGRILEWGVAFGDGEPRPSPSYRQASEMAEAGNRDHEPIELEDYAIVARFPNPFDDEGDGKSLVIAGIRAFGTWGAAEYLRTHWDNLYRQTNGRDFASLLQVKLTYHVTEATIVRVVLAPHPKVREGGAGNRSEDDLAEQVRPEVEVIELVAA